MLEAHNPMKRQVAVLVIREISEEYHLPDGMGLCMENARHVIDPLIKIKRIAILVFEQRFLQN